jgi:hypothetical protein
MAPMSCTAALPRSPWRCRQGCSLAPASPGRGSAPAWTPSPGGAPHLQGTRRPRGTPQLHHPFDLHHQSVGASRASSPLPGRSCSAVSRALAAFRRLSRRYPSPSAPGVPRRASGATTRRTGSPVAGSSRAARTRGARAHAASKRRRAGAGSAARAPRSWWRRSAPATIARRGTPRGAKRSTS